MVRILSFHLVGVACALLMCGCGRISGGASQVSGAKDTTQLSISSNNPSIEIAEGSSVALVIVFNRPMPQSTQVTWSIANSSMDFNVTSGTISVSGGDTSEVLNLNTKSDTIYQPDRHYTLVISGPKDIFPGQNSVGIPITVLEKDSVPRLSIDSTSVVEGSTATFTVSLSGASSQTVTVDYATSDVTAVGGTNYTSLTGTLTFNPGDLSKTVNISTVDTGVFNVAKTFHLTLSNPSNAILDAALGTGTITTNHPEPTITFSVATESTNKSAQATVNIAVQLSAVSGADTSVPFSIGGTASDGTEYTISASPITIAAGGNSANIAVTVINDGVVGSNKSVIMSLGTPTNSTLGATTTNTLTIVNDLLGMFNVSGVTGASDATLDAFLNGGTNATINWSASTNATSYDVTIYQNDATTVQCALTNTTSTSLSFNSCNLTAGQYYNAKVAAKASGGQLDASNSMYQFLVNIPPTPIGSGPYYVMKNGSVSIDVVTDAICGVPGCTITLQSSNNGTNGTVSVSGNNVIYSPSSNYTGTDSFTYTIADNRGGASTGTININIMTAFTWTGGGSDAHWTTGANWCGSINAGHTACLGGSAPGAGDTALFDATCVSNCSPTINSAINMGGLFMNSGYTGTITQGLGNTITVGASGWSQVAGTFTGSDANITINLPQNGASQFLLTGGTFTSTSAVLKISYVTINSSSSFTAVKIGTLATFNHNNGTVYFYSDDGWSGGALVTIDLGTLNLYNVIVHSRPNTYWNTTILASAGSNITVANNFTLEAGAIAGPGIWHVKGNISLTADAGNTALKNEGLSTLILDGSNDQTYAFTTAVDTSSIDLQVNKASGSVYAAAGTTNFQVAKFDLIQGSFTAPTGTFRIGFSQGGSSPFLNGLGNTTIVSIAAGTTFDANNGTVEFYNADSVWNASIFSISGPPTLNLHDVIISGNAYYRGGITVVSGTTVVANNYTQGATDFLVQGDWIVKGQYTSSAKADADGQVGTATFTFSGSADQSITCNSCLMPSGTVTANLSGGATLRLASNVAWNSASQLLNVVSGAFDMAGFNLTASSLTLNGNTLSKNGGVLTVGGVVQGTGALDGGTVNP